MIHVQRACSSVTLKLLAILMLLAPTSAASAQNATTTHVYTQAATENGPLPLELDIHRPDAGCSSDCPLIVFIHGGGFVSGSKDLAGVIDLLQDALAAGYAVAAIDYRLAGDRPVLASATLGFLETVLSTSQWQLLNANSGAGRQARAAIGAIEDTEAAIGWLAANAGAMGIDTSRAVLWGGSAGAGTSLNVGYGQQERGVTLPVDLVGIVDYWGGLQPFFTMEANDIPLMVVHGNADQTVAFQNALSLAAAAQATATDIWYLPLDGVGHGLSTVQPRTRTVRDVTVADHTVAFLDAVFGRAGTTRSRCLADRQQLCDDAAFGPPSIAASLLPGARSVPAGQPATAFASVVNAGQQTAENCRLNMSDGVDAAFAFQTTDTANMPIGTPSTPVDVLPRLSQSFVFSLTPRSVFVGQSVHIDFTCEAGVQAARIPGLTDFVLSSDPGAPDLLAIGVTPTSDGVIRIPGDGNRIGFLSAAAVTVGASDPVTVTVSADTGGQDLPVSLEVCETDSQGLCTSSRTPSPFAVVFHPDNPRLFAVFVRANEGADMPLAAADRRVFLRFSSDAVPRSVTSAAIASPLTNSH
ncbi:alpha/beta hydrolase [Hyphobacterium indicum]|uniref:alpha/beta hydrolase n=1 Tax=Hyphobacterium indicum TaxID=2162714 RepID=UPI001374FBF5|nr:alpha/beta hydrolase [Hyphobacterium indicum]